MQRLFVLLAICCLSLVLAYPQQQQPPYLTGGGGGSPRQGYDIHLDGRAPVWTSNNGRHSVDATGGYSQHLGGPYGNSRPDYRGGAVYTFRF